MYYILNETVQVYMGNIFNGSHKLLVLFLSNLFPLKQETIYSVLNPPFCHADINIMNLQS